ncbi:hypothetical protein ACFPT7_04985 [Acidicapsa dinghuensis]|uniref:DUF721 domain-containing protein n=1 Tax=Acidicapsa dinghuensis TaxID=2218256 RepID=A0ABW1EBG6_9BACT|nr:hypothetical protein [Acidicapsa dinghuensis]
MVVRTHEKHPDSRGIVGLHIGVLNVQEHFPRGLEAVELELDHLRIVCTLEPAFWSDSPVIHDQRLSLWLEAKRTSGKLSGKSAPVVLVPLEDGRAFRLQLMSKEEAERAVAAEDVKATPTVVANQPARSVVLLDRRQRDAEHVPERRRTARHKLLNLGGDERSSIAASH